MESHIERTALDQLVSDARRDFMTALAGAAALGALPGSAFADTPILTPDERDKVLRARNIGVQLRRRW